MRLKEMIHGVEAIAPEATVAEAAIKMSQEDVGMIPVVEKDKPIGVVTDRDITVRAVAQRRDPARTRVRDVMTRQAVYCFEDQDVEEAAKLMSEKQVRRMLVLNRENSLVGVVSLGDLATEPATEKTAGEVLEKVSEPGHRPHAQRKGGPRP